MNIQKASLTAALLALALLKIPPAKAETYNTCAGFIDSLPTVINTQGVWCLRKDLTTSMTSGNAITIAANNITIDCNGFKIGGLAAGPSSAANGVFASDRLNATVRNCTIRGYYNGIYLDGAGHLAEGNRLDQNLVTGISAWGENNRVQRNAVYDTGGATGQTWAVAIYGSPHIIDNTIAGVFGTTANFSPYGVYVFGDHREVSGNRVGNLVTSGTGLAYGIRVAQNGSTIANNRVSAPAGTAGHGISGYIDTFCKDNTVVGFVNAYTNCAHSDGNLPL